MWSDSSRLRLAAESRRADVCVCVATLTGERARHWKEGGERRMNKANEKSEGRKELLLDLLVFPEGSTARTALELLCTLSASAPSGMVNASRG